ncbi:hypothetical protein Tco_0854844 [Tanacetum coccineum]
MYCYSKSAIAISCNPVQHSCTKHINIRYHFIKKHAKQGIIKLYFIETEYQLAVVFTKALPKERFKYLVYRIVMRCMTPPELDLHVEYASLLWWDFLHCALQKKNVIQYPCFTKLIIIDLMEKEVTIREEEKRKQATGESSSPRLSLKIRIRQQKSTSTTSLPPSDDQERDDIIESTQLGLVLDKTTKVYEEQQNVAIVKEKLLDEDVEKLVEGNDESDEPESQKENPENNDDDEKKDEKHDDANDDDDDNNDRDNHALIKTRRTGSSEIRTEKMQTPIPSPLRSLRTDLSLDKEIDKELMVSVSPTPDATTQD